MDNFNEIINDLLNRGYEINLNKKNEDSKLTGRQIIYHVIIKKDGKKIISFPSKVSPEEALYKAYTIIPKIEKYLFPNSLQ